MTVSVFVVPATASIVGAPRSGLRRGALRCTQESERGAEHD